MTEELALVPLVEPSEQPLTVSPHKAVLYCLACHAIMEFDFEHRPALNDRDALLTAAAQLKVTHPCADKPGHLGLCEVVGVVTQEAVATGVTATRH